MSVADDLDEITRRILGGEDADAVAADLAARAADRRAWYAAERARLQAEADHWTAVMLRIEGKLH